MAAGPLGVLRPIACALSVCACSSAGSYEAKLLARSAADAGVAPVRALYKPGPLPMRFGDIPWPDDGYLNAMGHVAVRDLPSQAPGDYAAALTDAMAELDGFGLRPTIYFRFDGAVDPASLPQNPDATLATRSSVFLVDADTSSPDAFKRIAVEVTYDPSTSELRLRPAFWHALYPGRRYAAVVTSAVLAADGRHVDGAELFLNVRDPDNALTDPRARAARSLYGPVLETLASQGVARDHVVALAVFRVQSVGPDLADARALVRKAPPPMPVFTDALSEARLDAVLGVPAGDALGLDAGGPHAHIGWMVHGSFSSPNLISAKAGAHGTFERNTAGALRVKGQDDVYFTLWLPHGVAASAGYPVAIMQHGLGRDRSDALPLANALAGSGYAVIAIDAPFHGLRSGAGDQNNRFTGRASPDGFGDGPGDFAGQDDASGDLTPFHPFYYRDAVRQGAVDLATLVYLLQSGDWSGLSKLNPALDGVALSSARLPFIGIGLGGELGIMLSSIEPSVTALVLGFTGGLTVDGWLPSPGAQPLMDALLTRVGRDPGQIDWSADSPLLWPDIDAWRMLTDRASGLSLAPALRRLPTNVLMLMAQGDEEVHNLSSEALADALGAELIGGEPQFVESLQTNGIRPGATLSGNFHAEGGAVTRVLYLLDPATHDTLTLARGIQHYAQPLMRPFAALPNPIVVTNPIAPTMTQIAFLLESLRACTPAPANTTPMLCAASVQAPASP